jgi:hypothetical protein
MITGKDEMERDIDFLSFRSALSAIVLGVI